MTQTPRNNTDYPGQRENRPPISRIIEEQQIDLEVEQVGDVVEHPPGQRVLHLEHRVHGQ
jgi:hypothetical protein